jgi:hypothetical protein
MSFAHVGEPRAARAAILGVVHQRSAPNPPRPRAAGADLRKLPVERWTRGHLYVALWRLHRAGVVMAPETIRAAGFGTAAEAAIRLCGDLPSALRAVRLPPSLAPSMTEDEAIAELQWLSHDGYLPSAADIPGHLRAALRIHFGSITSAAYQLGLRPRRTGKWLWDAGALREELHRLDAHGVPLTEEQLARRWPELLQVVLRDFGSVREACRQAGIAGAPRTFDRRTALAELRRLSRGGLRVRATALGRLGHDRLLRACERFYGGVERALVAAQPEPVMIQPPAHLMLIGRVSRTRSRPPAKANARPATPRPAKKQPPTDLAALIRAAAAAAASTLPGAGHPAPYVEARQAFERHLVVEAVARCSGDSRKAAKLLGVSHSTIKEKLRAARQAGQALEAPARRRRRGRSQSRASRGRGRKR